MVSIWYLSFGFIAAFTTFKEDSQPENLAVPLISFEKWECNQEGPWDALSCISILIGGNRI